MIPERRRLTYALLLSLLIHTWLLSLIFGGEGLWLPAFSFPWQDRRIEVPDLRVVVVPPQVTAAEPTVTPVAEPMQQARVKQPAPGGPTPFVARPRVPQRTAAAIVPEADPKAEAEPRTDANARKDAAAGTSPAKMPSRGDVPGDAAPPPIPAPAVIAVEATEEPTWVVPATPPMPTPVVAAAPSVSNVETATPSLGDDARARGDQEAPEPAAEPAKLVPSKQEVKRQAEQVEVARPDAAPQEAARVENAKLEAERQEAARAEEARVEAARVENAKLEAERQEAARAEAARAEAARVEAARVEAARAEAERQEAARAEAARVEAARAEAARDEAARVETERREAARRAMGRQLDEEAARREAAKAAAGPSQSLPPPWSSARRYRLFGRTDPNEELILWAEAWSRKIELNMTFDMVREAAKQPHTDPLVWVAIRRDGSVESVKFATSSGVAAIDEAIERIVRSQAPYQVFSPSLAREYDVLEIRRTWHFDTAIRLY